MNRVTTLTTGGIALIVALAGCGKQPQADVPRKTAKVRAEVRRQRTACASPVVNDRLKGLVFDQAIGAHRGGRTSLDELADYSFARLEDPVVTGADPALDIIRCKGRFVLDIPDGAERAFAGERRLQADVDYTAQAAADGSGFVYRISGADAIVARLASFNLTSGAYRPPPAIDGAPDRPAPTAAPPVVVQAAPVRTPRDLAPAQPPVREREVAAAPRPPRPIVERDPEQVAVDRPSQIERVPRNDDGEAAVRAFYAALGTGDGDAAATRIVPEKRTRGAFSPAAMSRYYGALADPIRLTSIAAIAPGSYRVGYRYAAGRSRCAGAAIVTTTQRDGRDLIRSIRALNGC